MNITRWLPENRSEKGRTFEPVSIGLAVSVFARIVENARKYKRDHVGFFFKKSHLRLTASQDSFSDNSVFAVETTA